MRKQQDLIHRFRARLTMESDWHVGSGTGRPGNVDRLILRDGDGLPYIPAKTLHCVWRDACERLCRGLDDGNVGEWSRSVDYLFGSQPALGEDDPSGRHQDPTVPPLAAAVRIRSARIATDLRRLVASDRRLREAMTFIKPGVEIDPRTGNARTKHLRFEEMARVGTVLEAECQLTVPEEMRDWAMALLVASSRLVERLGGKRRRGAGRCRLQIVDADWNWAVQWLTDNAVPPKWHESANSSDSGAPSPPCTQSIGQWMVVPLVLELQSPLAVSYRTVGNVVETLDYLPGSYLLKHVTQTLHALGFDARPAIQAGNLCVLPATVEIDGRRGEPIPSALFAPKVGTGLANPKELVNRLLDVEPEDVQLKQIRDGYLRSDAPAKAVKPPPVVRTHNTIEDGPQRPTPKVGGVYTYEAIAPVENGRPTRLRSELRLRREFAEQLEQKHTDWWKALGGEVSLGRSKKDDYGSVLLTAERAAPFSSTRPPIFAQNNLFVWLLSDTLIRGGDLRPSPTSSALAAELGSRLGVKLQVRTSADGRLDELVRVRRLDTWNVGWRLPRPSFLALQAGSCVVFQIEGSLDAGRLADIEAGGIGERTAEGYGQICFNDRLVAMAPSEKWTAPVAAPGQTPDDADRPVIHRNHPAWNYACVLEEEAWNEQIRRACLGIASDSRRRQELLGWIAAGEQGRPPMSQLGGLRSQLALLKKPNDDSILGWLKHLANNPRRKDRWPRESLEAVRGLLSDQAQIWNLLGCGDPPKLTDDAVERLQEKYWVLAVRSLFDACIRSHKRELERHRSREVQNVS